MKQQAFEARYHEFWRALEQELQVLDAHRGGSRLQPDFPARYRQLCQQLAVARDRHYTPTLIQRLNRMALDGHRLLYRKRGGLLASSIDFATGGFARLVRRYWRLFAVSNLLFYGPLIAIAVWCYDDAEHIYSVMDYGTVAQLEDSYDPSNERIGTERQSDSDFFMFGYYILNNIGIAFRTFAGGLLGGIGAMFILLFNGTHIGAVTGHLTQLGYTETFFSFVITHGAFELTAIVLAGLAGMMLGFALIWPGVKSRGTALRLAAKDAAQIMFGVFAMLLLAAFIEAFWSSSATVVPQVKYAVGSACWAAVGAYFCFAGRRRHAA